jgi:hypothetical protein
LATDEELAAVFTRLAEAYPNYQLPDASMKLYIRMWVDVDGEALFAAVHGHISECRFFPAIAELLERAKAYEKTKRQVAAGANALEKIRGWKQEALAAGESRKMLTALTDAAGKRKGMEIVPFRGRGFKQALANPEKPFVVEADDERKAAVLEKSK